MVRATRLFPVSVRLHRALVPVLVLLLVLSACGGRDTLSDYGSDKASIDLQLGATLATAEATAVTILLTTPAGVPIAGAQVEVEGTMTHAGMAPVIARASEQGAGRYIVEDFQFTMGGDWLMITRATLPDGGRVQRTFPVNGVKEGASGVAPAAWGKR